MLGVFRFWIDDIPADAPSRRSKTIVPQSSAARRHPLAPCNVTLYDWPMIRSFRHKGVETFYRTGATSGIQAKHGKRLRLQLARLDVARGPNDMAAPGWGLHPLRGKLADHWAVWVDSHWRLTFAFQNGDVVLVDYQDYH